MGMITPISIAPHWVNNLYNQRILSIEYIIKWFAKDVAIHRQDVIH